MDLYSVYIETYYNASYEGAIDTSETRLVISNSIEEAVTYVRKDLERIDFSSSSTRLGKITARKIDLDKVKRKRNIGYYRL